MHDTEAMDGLYGEGTAKPDKSPESVDEEEREEMANTAIVPMKVLQSGDGEPVKEGDEVVLKVVHVYGEDEVEVAYSNTKPTSIPASEEEDDYGKELDSMDEG